MKIGPINNINGGRFWFFFGISRRGIALDLYLPWGGFNFEIRLPDLFLVGGTINFVSMGAFTRFSYIKAEQFRIRRSLGSVKNGDA